MRVPPPYVPPLSNSLPAFASGTVESPAIKTPTAEVECETPVAPPQEKSSKPYLALVTSLTIREKLLTLFFVASLLLVPAMMSSGSVDAQQFNPSDPRLQSVERAEENFAGSAFYFIDPNYAIPQNYGGLGIDPLAQPGDAAPIGLSDDPANDRDATHDAPYIRPVAFRGSAMDNSRALHCLTQAIYYEAGMEPDVGQRAVAQVILNRVRHPSYPGTVCGVIYQGSERRTGCQFSYTCDGSLRRKPNKFHWNRSKKVASQALAGKIYTTVGTATHYHATYVYPYWAPSLRFLGTIGAHRFYSWKGNAGKARAFNQKYRGSEPVPAPKPRKYDVAKAGKASQALDPIALEKAYEVGLKKAQQDTVRSERAAALAADNARRHDLPVPTINTGKAPSYRAPNYSAEAQAKGGDNAFSGERLPDIGRIKPEFRNSGSWKRQPGG